ncbi:interleukin-18 isoform 1-T1 [Hipposideros larvatus]
MAAEPEDNYISFVEMKFIDNTLYFVAENDEDLESDYFGKLEPRFSIIRNLNNQVLFIRAGHALLEDMTDADCEANASQTTFIIYMYKDNLARGLAVALSVKYGKISTLSCKDKAISFKEMNPPDYISEEESEIIFFKRSVPGHDKILFESSLYKGYFLACKKENNLFRLILKEKDKQGDESIMFTVQYKD